MNDLLTIIVPIYNSEQYLPYCLGSILKQTYSNWEALLIDDESSDQSSEICKKYVAEDARFKYFRKRNGGVADARNYGLERASGEFIAFVDNDDVLHPEMYTKLIHAANKYNVNVAACDFLMDYRNYEDVISWGEKLPKESIEILEGKNRIYRSIVTSNKRNGVEGLIWNKIYRNQCFKTLRFHTDIALVDDAVMSIELFKNVDKVAHIQVPMYHWMQHKTNQTMTGSYQKYESACKGYDYIIAEAQKLKLADDIVTVLQSQRLLWNVNTLDRMIAIKSAPRNVVMQRHAMVKSLYPYRNLYTGKIKLKIELIARCWPLYQFYIWSKRISR